MYSIFTYIFSWCLYSKCRYINIPIIHGSSKCVRFFASLTIFYPKKPTVLRQKKMTSLGSWSRYCVPYGIRSWHIKKSGTFIEPPKHSATLVGILSKIPTLLGRSKVGNSLASVQAWKKAMSSVVHLQGVGVSFSFSVSWLKKRRVWGLPIQNGCFRQ